MSVSLRTVCRLPAKLGWVPGMRGKLICFQVGAGQSFPNSSRLCMHVHVFFLLMCVWPCVNVAFNNSGIYRSNLLVLVWWLGRTINLVNALLFYLVDFQVGL